MKKVLVIFGILCIILIVLIIYQKSEITDEGIKIFYKNQEFFLSFAKIRLIEQISFKTKGGNLLNGYNISNILNSIDIPTSSISSFTFHSRDGGSLTLIKNENETSYLVFQEDTTSEFIRLVIPTDEFSQRWIKYIVTIVIE